MALIEKQTNVLIVLYLRIKLTEQKIKEKLKKHKIICIKIVIV